MTACVESTVISWHEMAMEWLNLQGNVFLPVLGEGGPRPPLGPAESIDPFPWGGMPQLCYDNVTYLVKLLGGEPVYGWALADSGPLSERISNCRRSMAVGSIMSSGDGGGNHGSHTAF
jgi:hypothetical protein